MEKSYIRQLQNRDQIVACIAETLHWSIGHDGHWVVVLFLWLLLSSCVASKLATIPVTVCVETPDNMLFSVGLLS